MEINNQSYNWKIVAENQVKQLQFSRNTNRFLQRKQINC